MTPLERAARAAAAHYGDDFDKLPAVNPIANGDLDQRHFLESARAMIEAIRDALDESGLVEGARQAAEIDGSTAATWVSMTYDDVLAWLDAAAAEGA